VESNSVDMYFVCFIDFIVLFFYFLSEKPHICPVCNKTFTQKQYLNYHQTSHPELQMPRFICPEEDCGRSFTEPSSLRGIFNFFPYIPCK